MRRLPRLELLLASRVVLGAHTTLAQTPALQYDPPAGFFGGGGVPLESGILPQQVAGV